MGAIIGRDYCLKHPITIIQLFGIGVLLGVLLQPRKGLLEHAMAFHQRHGFAFPGHIGRAYRLAALLEARVARFYGHLAKRFADQPAVHTFFRELQEEEEEHCRLMQLCRYTVAIHPRLKYLPSLRDREVQELLVRLRHCNRKAATLSLEEALDLTVELERSEINTIFDRLLKQTDQTESRLFETQMAATEDHAEVVPQRVEQLRRQLYQQAA